MIGLALTHQAPHQIQAGANRTRKQARGGRIHHPGLVRSRGCRSGRGGKSFRPLDPRGKWADVKSTSRRTGFGVRPGEGYRPTPTMRDEAAMR